MSGAPVTLNWADLSSLYPNNPKVVQAFLQLFQRTASNTAAVTTGATATEALADATVVTLSSNTALNNERILAIDPATLVLTDNGPGNTLVLALLYDISTGGGYRLRLDLSGDTEVTLPAGGRIPGSVDGPYANDAAAAAAGIQVGEWYAVTGGSIAWRQT